MIQGDVGSGKTIVAFLAMFAAMENGYQAALMAPTEILAEQHARNARRIFDEYRLPSRIAYRQSEGCRKAKSSRRYRSPAKSRSVIGTHAIIQEASSFENLGLAVIDEQHRFGVLQRAQLRALGYNPDILVMTATPIPRSLAMTVYGDLDVSVIDELPPGRTPIKTVVVGEDQREGVYKGIEREIGLGRQVYIVYPLIEESEKIDLKAATIMYEDLRDKVFPESPRRPSARQDEELPKKKRSCSNFVAGELEHSRFDDRDRGRRRRAERVADGHRARRAIRPFAASSASRTRRTRCRTKLLRAADRR